MFKSKYIFETKQTRALRYLKAMISTMLCFFIVYLMCGYFFIQHATNEKNKALEKFYRMSPDIVVIFTGAQGRIPHGIKLAKKFKQSNIYITGVYDKNNIQTIINPLTINEEIDTKLIEIDYYAQNTVENVFSTLRYLREKKDFHNILIISHDYHIPRIQTIISKTKSKQDKFDFYFIGVESNFKKQHDLKVLYKEVYKFLRTYAFLTIWDI